MTFDSDAFISYAHLDNLPLVEGSKGWVEEFHRALEVRLAQMRGKSPEIWRDPKLQGNDFFADTLVVRLGRVAVLISIVSPPYIHSKWTRRELIEFWKSATEQGGVRVGDKSRVFKVVKTPVPLDEQPPEIQPLLGYEFFREDPATGRILELNRAFGKELEFLMKVDDVAFELCALLKCLDIAHDLPSESPTTSKGTVYLAETTADLRDERDSIRRELQQHGYTVLPTIPLPVIEAELRPAVEEQLDRSQLSIHLVGHHYSLVPEGGVESLVEIQNDIAVERAAKGGFTQLVWIAPGLTIEDERQRKVVDQLRMNPRIHEGSDLLEVSLETLKTVIQDRLRSPSKTSSPSDVQLPSTESVTHLYLICDMLDLDAIQPWKRFLFEQGIEVLTPDFEGTPTEVRESHEDNLRLCDAVLIHYGSATESWLRRKMREVQKSPAFGRTKPLRAVGITLAPPRSSQKELFQTHEATVIPQLDGFSPDLLIPFIRQAKGLAASQASP